MNFIKEIFDENPGKLAHLQFQKFSKGEFRNKAIIEAKNSKGKYTIKTSPEFTNELVMIMAKKLGENTSKIKGALVSTHNLKEEEGIKDLVADAEVKQFQGVKRYLIDTEIKGNDLVGYIERFPKTFFALSFGSDSENQLKIKPKAPKSGKPGKGDEAPKADFCNLKTTDSEIMKSFVIEKPNLDFKDAKINHTYLINEIIIPEEIKKTGDFKKMREEALRKGKIIRNSEIDSEKKTSEKEFQA